MHHDTKRVISAGSYVVVSQPVSHRFNERFQLVGILVVDCLIGIVYSCIVKYLSDVQFELFYRSVLLEFVSICTIHLLVFTCFVGFLLQA